MIIISDGSKRGEQYVERHGDGHKVLNWSELDAEGRKSIVMLVDQEPGEFPAVVDHGKRLFEGVSKAPQELVDAHDQKKQEKEEKKRRKKQAKAEMRKKKVANVVERLREGKISNKELQEVVAELVELVGE